MIEHRMRPVRAKLRPDNFGIFDPGLDQEVNQELAIGWAAMRLGTEPDERSIAVLWNLLLAYPLDENCVRRVPEEVHGLIGEWRPWLQGRPGWSFDTPDEER